jgi:hypothetical protein
MTNKKELTIVRWEPPSQNHRQSPWRLSLSYPGLSGRFRLAGTWWGQGDLYAEYIGWADPRSREQGAGSTCLGFAFDFLLNEGFHTIRGYPSSTGKRGIPQDPLVSWYKSFGAVPDTEDGRWLVLDLKNRTRN